MTARKPSKWATPVLPIRWRDEYRRHWPVNTCGASRHARIVSEEILGNPKHPLREHLAPWEPDHWAQSIGLTVLGLWRARAKIRQLEHRIKELESRETA